MNGNERVYVDKYTCFTEKDDFDDGESLYDCGVGWGCENFNNAKNGYGNASDALKAVCEENAFSFDKGDWIFDDDGLFKGDVLVDIDNNEASESDIEKWKRGEKSLWRCYITVKLEVKTSRDLTIEECRL